MSLRERTIKNPVFATSLPTNFYWDLFDEFVQEGIPNYELLYDDCPSIYAPTNVLDTEDHKEMGDYFARDLPIDDGRIVPPTFSAEEIRETVNPPLNRIARSIQINKILYPNLFADESLPVVTPTIPNMFSSPINRVHVHQMKIIEPNVLEQVRQTRISDTLSTTSSSSSSANHVPIQSTTLQIPGQTSIPIQSVTATTTTSSSSASSTTQIPGQEMYVKPIRSTTTQRSVQKISDISTTTNQPDQPTTTTILFPNRFETNTTTTFPMFQPTFVQLHDMRVYMIRILPTIMENLCKKIGLTYDPKRISLIPPITNTSLSIKQFMFTYLEKVREEIERPNKRRRLSSIKPQPALTEIPKRHFIVRIMCMTDMKRFPWSIYFGLSAYHKESITISLCASSCKELIHKFATKLAPNLPKISELLLE